MKKMAILVLMAVSSFSMTACGNNKDVKPSNTPEAFGSSFFNEVEESRARGRAAGEAAGFDMTDVPSWDEVKAAREADPVNCPECYWESKDLLHTKVDGVIKELSPKEAVRKYHLNEDFMREYIFLMKER